MTTYNRNGYKLEAFQYNAPAPDGWELWGVNALQDGDIKQHADGNLSTPTGFKGKKGDYVIKRESGMISFMPARIFEHNYEVAK